MIDATGSRSVLAASSLLTVCALIVCSCSSGGHHSSAPVSSTVPPAAAATTTTVKLSSGASQLLALLAKGRGANYHAAYASSVQGTAVTLELWQKPPLTRRDTSFTPPGGAVTKTEEFKLHDQIVGCIQRGSSAWKCSAETAASGTDPSSGVVADLSKVLSNRAVKVDNQTVAGRAARCFTAPAVGPVQQLELCATPDSGIPLLVNAGAGTITLTMLDRVIPDNVFTLPASPTPTTGTVAP